MDLLSVIRRWRFRQKMALREIERRSGLSRNTIRKYLRADTVEPQFKVSVVKTFGAKWGADYRSVGLV